MIVKTFDLTPLCDGNKEARKRQRESLNFRIFGAIGHQSVPRRALNIFKQPVGSTIKDIAGSEMALGF
jgi:hypothetical protein